MAQWFQSDWSLHITKLFERRIQRLHRIEYKGSVTTLEDILSFFNFNWEGFLSSFLTAEDTWIHLNTSEKKQQSKQLVSSSKLVLKKAKVVSSANKVMATVFLDVRGIILICNLQKEKRNNGDYNTNLWNWLSDDLDREDYTWQSRKCSFTGGIHMSSCYCRI